MRHKEQITYKRPNFFYKIHESIYVLFLFILIKKRDKTCWNSFVKLKDAECIRAKEMGKKRKQIVQDQRTTRW